MTTRIKANGVSFLLVVVLLVGTGLRVYRLNELVIFLGDQGRDVTAVWEMLETGELAQVGPGSSFGHFLRGPAYYYFLLAGLAAGGGDPAGAALGVALLDAVTVFLVFIAGRLLGGIPAGVASAGLYACAGAAVTIARHLANPSLLPFFSLLTVIAMVLWIQGDTRFLVVAVGALVAAWQMHDQAVLLVMWAVAVGLVWRPRVTARAILGATLVAVLLLASFLLYESGNHWGNLRAMFEYGFGAAVESNRADGASAVGVRIGETWRVLEAFLPFTDPWHWLLVGAAAASFALLVVNARRRPSKSRQVILSYCALPALYLIWPGPVYSLNMAIVLPVPFLLVGYGFAELTRHAPRVRVPLAALVALICGASAIGLFVRLNGESPERTSLGATQGAVVSVLRRAEGRPFFWWLETDQENMEAYDAPWRYLFKWYGAEAPTIKEPQSFVIFTPASRATGEMASGPEIQGIRIVRLGPPRIVAPNLIEGGELTRSVDVEQWMRRVTTEGAVDWDPSENALRLTGGGGSVVSARQRFRVQPGVEHLVQYQVKTSQRRGTPHVYLLCFDGRGGFVDTLPFSTGYPTVAGSTWQVNAFLVRTPSDCARASMWLHQQGEGTSWFRNVGVYPAEVDILP
jgi:4-amino-4-deoxy-L-arabinose transferase-like glycosyltransferase